MSETAPSREQIQETLSMLEAVIRLDGFVPPFLWLGDLWLGDSWAEQWIAPLLEELELDRAGFRYHLAPCGEVGKDGVFRVLHNAVRVTVCHATNARIECVLEGQP